MEAAPKNFIFTIPVYQTPPSTFKNQKIFVSQCSFNLKNIVQSQKAWFLGTPRIFD
jgi:hypothetical protein